MVLDEAQWLRQWESWQQRPGHAQRLACYACGLSSAELAFRSTRGGKRFYQVRCGACGLWGQTKHLGACFLAGMSEAYRQTPAAELYAELVALTSTGAEIWSRQAWGHKRTPSGREQRCAQQPMPCLFCGVAGLCHLRLDRTGRPYTPCDGCGSRAFYRPSSPSLYAGLGLAQLAVEQAEQWATISQTGAASLEALERASTN